MAFSLAHGETILFPMPYVEAERPPFVVTNHRLIERSEAGERTLQVKSLVAASRAKSRPYASLGALLFCLGMGTLGVGAYFYFSVFGMEAAPYKALLPPSGEEETKPEGEEAKQELTPEPVARPDDIPDDPSAEHPDDKAWRLDVLRTRLLGMGLGALGALIAMGGLRAFGKRRYFVVCRTRESFMRIVVDGKIQQDIILATIQAVK